MSSSVSLVSLKNIHNLWVLPVRALLTSIGSVASSECALVVSGGLAEGLGCGLIVLIRVMSTFGNCTRYVRGARRSKGARVCQSVAVFRCQSMAVSRCRSMEVSRCQSMAVSFDSVGVVDRCSREAVDQFLLKSVDRCSRGAVDQFLLKSPLSSRTRIMVATMSHGSVSIDVRTEVSIDVGWKISVDGRVVSVDGGERVSVDETGVWFDDGWRELNDELVLLSIDEEHLSFWIERSKLEGFDENSIQVSLLVLVLLDMH
ncbi:hypothetical protein IGI04_040522 [Brassica rapa subsp. trilocularis]|uniref:Uncharacterized protein n=1 Tax=Brassica rapa subsp. trilocularis TaxID=1813537 RepID=A0ABQ7KR08_BRACM|nr:hypothetical protein IGI04_040522 [Brassica rapa subsp. trilocularis]